MKKIFITGGAGFIGTNASKYFAKKGNKCLSLEDCLTTTECPEINTDKKS